MLENLFGNMQGKQEEMKKKLAEVVVEAEVDGGSIRVKANANREILDIIIDPDKIDLADKEQLQDLMVIAVNQALEIAAEREAAEAQQMINDMMPPGLGGLLGGFNQ